MSTTNNTIDTILPRYELQLTKVQDRLRAHHQWAWVDVLGSWLEELRAISDPKALRTHTARTARSLGGMESLGELATIVSRQENDSELRNLIEELYAICKFILST